MSKVFHFRHFDLVQDKSSHKMGMDAMVLGSWVQPGDAMNILDIGTGTGVLALMMAQRSEAIVDALEIDPEATKEAAYNFEKSPWPHRLTCHHTSLQEYALNPTIHYDLIVCNPPYFDPINTDKGNNRQIPGPERSLARFTASLGFEELLDGVSKLMVSYGRFFVVLPSETAANFILLAEKHGLFLSERLDIRSFALSEPVRAVLGFTREGGKVAAESLTIYKDDKSWTEEYAQLTVDFHSKR